LYFFLKIETNREPFPLTSKNKIMQVYLGELEELVLLTVASLDGGAYGVSIQLELKKRCKRSITIGALHSTITRLVEKGMLKSWTGGATEERGGRSKRFYDISPLGKSSLVKVKDLRDELWDLSKVKLSSVK
jgi:PadR family transcriptional regulator PadR